MVLREVNGILHDGSQAAAWERFISRGRGTSLLAAAGPRVKSLLRRELVGTSPALVKAVRQRGQGGTGLPAQSTPAIGEVEVSTTSGHTEGRPRVHRDGVPRRSVARARRLGGGCGYGKRVEGQTRVFLVFFFAQRDSSQEEAALRGVRTRVGGVIHRVVFKRTTWSWCRIPKRWRPTHQRLARLSGSPSSPTGASPEHPTPKRTAA